MRNPLKRRSRDETKPTLRERFAATKAKAGALLLRPRPDHEADQSRRAVLAGSLAVAVPLPALAATVQASTREAAFLALAPEIMPLLRRLGPALAEKDRRSEAAEADAGTFPGWSDEAVGKAWLARLHAA